MKCEDLRYVVPCVMLAMGVLGSAWAAPDCPPGGRYWDKHLGQNGRWACCSELCEPPGMYQDQCTQKCPTYESDKAGVAPDRQADSVRNTSHHHDFTSIVYYIVIFIAVALIITIVVIVVRRRKVGANMLSSACPSLTSHGRSGTPGMNREEEPDVRQGQNQLHTGQQTESIVRLLPHVQECPPADGEGPCVNGGLLNSLSHPSQTSGPYQTAGLESYRSPIQAEQDGTAAGGMAVP